MYIYDVVIICVIILSNKCVLKYYCVGGFIQIMYIYSMFAETCLIMHIFTIIFFNFDCHVQKYTIILFIIVDRFVKLYGRMYHVKMIHQITTVLDRCRFWCRANLGSIPSPVGNLGVPPQPREKTKLYLVLSPKTPKNHSEPRIFQFYCNFKLYFCDSKLSLG